MLVELEDMAATQEWDRVDMETEEMELIQAEEDIPAMMMEVTQAILKEDDLKHE